MGCQKAIPFNLVSTGDMPLSNACYCALTDKIYGTMGSYVVQFNATTGAKENIARVAAPITGPCRICFHVPTGMLYVSCWYDPSYVDQTTGNDSPRCDIFPVNPASLAVGAAVGLQAMFPLYFQSPTRHGLNGPWSLVSSGDYLYFSWRYQGGGGQLGRFNPAIPANKNIANPFGWSNWNSNSVSVGDVGGISSVIWPDPDNDFAFGNADFTGFRNVIPTANPDETPVAIYYDGQIAWAVCGNQWLLGCDLSLGGPYTAFNLEAGTTSPLKPFTVRYRALNDSLYIACQNKDVIILRNQGTAVLSMKTGFDGPVDVVVTPTKVFAVQSGPIGLKEIT